jgi:iron(III) transport system ATP-binding protein
MLPLQQGSILLDGEVLADAGSSPPPEARPVGLVFQDGALFPHMTIAANIVFGLPKGRRSEAEGWLAQVGLAGLGARYPHELSGGQQQRAALARAMAPGPQVLLMDEPFASVDIVPRSRLRRDCRILLRERGATAVLVTHDPAEALDIGDRIAVMEAGRIVQFASPQELHDAPASAAVGAMFGGAQVVPGARGEGGLVTPFGLWAADGVSLDGAAFDLLVHADALELVPDAAGLRVRDCHLQGKGVRVVLVAADGAEITAETTAPVDPAQRYRVAPRPGSLRVFVRS